MDELIETESRIEVTRGWGKQKGGVTVQWVVSVWNDDE